MITIVFCFLFFFLVRRPLTITILADSMAKHISGLKNTTMQVFPGANITKLHNILQSHRASINFKHTILAVGTNDVPSKLKIGEIMSLYENLVNYIRSHSDTNLIIAAIIPRPCDLQSDPKENRVKSLNKELELLCKRRKLTFLHTYRIFLHNNYPIRSYFAIRDNGLHLNTEGTRKLKLFLCNTVSHLR